MSPAEATDLLEQVTEAWVADPASDVVWAGAYEGRWGIRIRQQCRDATTMWFSVGDLTVGYEAYLLPKPAHREQDVYRHCLVRNYRSWPAAIAIDDQGDLYVRGRIHLDRFSSHAIDEAVGAVYEVVELSFRQLVAMGFSQREKSS
jgi:hypothetical protein